MNTVITLDFSSIRSSETPLPNVGVLDIEPMHQIDPSRSQRVRGHVLLLNEKSSLRRPINVSSGAAALTLRLPTGEILSQTIEVQGGAHESPTVSFKVAGELPVRERLPQLAREDTPQQIVGKQERSDRKRWGIVVRSDSRIQSKKLSSFLDVFARDVVREKHDGHGLARVQSEASTFAVESSLRTNRVSNAALVGEITAVQPVKLYGDLESMRTGWQRPLANRKLVETDFNEATSKRYFAVGYEVRQSAKPQHLACIPGNWRVLGEDKLSGVTIGYASERQRDGELEHVLRVQVKDLKTQGLLEFMQTGDLYASASLMRNAHVYLYEKSNNPYAAAAAGYVLVRTGMPGRPMDWGRWVFNLATRFPALPDGNILLATLLLQGPRGARREVPGVTDDEASEHQLALKAALGAAHRGPPLFRMGLRQLQSNIQILQGLYKDAEEESLQLEEALAYVQDLTARVDRSQPFSVFDVSSDSM